MFALEQKAANNTHGLMLADKYQPISYEAPTRPLMFPFFTFLVHLARGIQPENVFVLNFLAGALCLYFFSLMFIGFSFKIRALSILALAANPSFSIFVTSGSFDPFSLLFGILVFLLYKETYLRITKVNLEALCLTALLYTQIRYETLLILPIIFISLLLRYKNEVFDIVNKSLLIGLSPLFLIPSVLQRILTWGQFENLAGKSAFSLTNFYNHYPSFIDGFFLNFEGPFPIVFHWFGLIGFIGLVVKLKQQRGYFFSYSIFTGLIAFLLIAHHMGEATLPTQVRLFLPISVALSATGIYFFAKHKWLSNPLALAVVFAQLLSAHAYAVKDPLTSKLTLTRETQWLRPLLEKMDMSSTLVIYRRPGQLTAFGFGAISPEYFESHSQEIFNDLVAKKFSRILLIENLLSEKKISIPKSFVKSTIHEKSFSPKYHISISKFTATHSFDL